MHYSHKAIALSLLLGLTPCAQGAEPAKAPAAKTSAVPPASSAKKACATSTGETKVECEKVAAKIDAHSADPAANPIVESDRSPSGEIHHSSPVMVTPQEKAATEATRRELEKTEKAKKVPPAEPPPKQ